MSAVQTFAYLTMAAILITQVAMLSLQVGAYRRHGHISFLLLTIATICGLFYLGVSLIRGYWPSRASPPSIFYIGSFVLLFGQMTLGVWGTAALFKSYRQLSDRSTLKNSDENA